MEEFCSVDSTATVEQSEMISQDPTISQSVDPTISQSVDPTISQSVVSGFGWTGISLVGKQIFQFIVLAILARLLTPTDFGLVALILIITDFLAIFNGEMGFAEALIQRKELNKEYLYSIFWLNIFIGSLIGTCIFVLIPMIARFYAEPALVPIGRALAINFPVYALRTIPLVLLRRQMNFKQLGIIELLSVVVGGGIAIFLASIGFGVWSLVLRTILTMLTMVIGLWLIVDWRPKLVFRISAIRDLWGYSRNVIGFYIWDYWTRRADNLLIGKILGSTMLGYYTRAYATALIPLQVALVTRRVLLPALSRVQNNIQESKRICLQAFELVAFIVTPAMFGLFAVAEYFVVVIYGEKWLPIVGPMRWLCVVGLLLAYGSIVDSIYKAQGRTDLLFIWGIVSGTAAIVSFSVGIYLGSIEAVAACYALTLSTLFYWQFFFAGRLIDIQVKEIALCLRSYITCASLMAAGIYLVDTVAKPSVTLVNLLLLIGTGMGIYLIALELIRPTSYVRIKQWIIRGRENNAL